MFSRFKSTADQAKQRETEPDQETAMPPSGTFWDYNYAEGLLYWHIGQLANNTVASIELFKRVLLSSQKIIKVIMIEQKGVDCF